MREHSDRGRTQRACPVCLCFAGIPLAIRVRSRAVEERCSVRIKAIEVTVRSLAPSFRALSHLIQRPPISQSRTGIAQSKR